MAKKYDNELTAIEVFDFLRKYDEYDEPCKGFAEEDIVAVEKKYNIKFPKTYKDYLTYCGYHPINSEVQDYAYKPSEIQSNYDIFEKDLQEYYVEDFKDKSKEEIEEIAEDDPLCKLYLLPREEWYKVVPEYILIWIENQGCWEAGYLRSDLEKGIEDAPVYFAIDGEEFEPYEKTADNTDQFIKSVLWTLIECIDECKCISSKEEIIKFLEYEGLDISLIEKDGINMCLDTDKNILYASFVYEESPYLSIIDPKLWEEEYEDE